MEQLLHMKKQLISAIMPEMDNLQNANTKELGEAIDMVKDLSEAIYYCSVTKAMNEEAERRNKVDDANVNNYYYTEQYVPYEMYNKNMDHEHGKLYYPHSDSSTMNHYTERDYPTMRDSREGRSPVRRKMYMESKSTH